MAPARAERSTTGEIYQFRIQRSSKTASCNVRLQALTASAAVHDRRALRAAVFRESQPAAVTQPDVATRRPGHHPEERLLLKTARLDVP